MSSSSKTVVWFRRDLRIEDNPALSSACRDGSVLPVFIWCPEEEGQFYPGRCSRWWLKESLIHLDQSLRALGTPLVFIKAESTLAALVQCIDAIGATKVVFNHLYDPVSLVRDHKVKAHLTVSGLTVQSFNGDLLHEPWEIYDDDGNAFTNFDAYWAKCMSLPMEPTLILPPWKLVPAAGSEKVESCLIEGLCLENDVERSSNALLKRGWSPGWSSADKMLAEFINDHLLHYSKDRMKVEGATTSLLSPYLHFGELSVRKIYQSVRVKQIHWAKEGNSIAEESVNLYFRAIGLREYSRYLCFNFPFTHERSLLGNLRHYPWRSDEGQFKSWRQGRTGYPLVDAGMRELWATGWMHNRIRVIAASFLVKFLLFPWTKGMRYFWDTLLDADLECDILGWQYISGSLPDGHELNRLDSPEVQGFRYDPEGHYVRAWLPELSRMPAEWIHHPWDAPKSVLHAAGVELGLNYPNPIVDINTAMVRLDDAVAMMWELDRAARASKLNGSAEVVADNLPNTKVLDIPKVVVKKEVSASTSSLDQRVPSFQNLKDGLCEKGENKLNRKKVRSEEIMDENNDAETSKMAEDDLRSTAESSSSRKRSFTESQCAVPSSCFSVSYGRAPYELDSFKPLDLMASSSVHVVQEADGSGVEKEEDAEAQSSYKG